MIKTVFMTCLVTLTLHARYKALINSLQKQCNVHDTLILGDFKRNFSCPPLLRFRIINNNNRDLMRQSISIVGLDKLRASGSSQFTPNHLRKINKKIHKIDPAAQLYILDLRQEHHGFIKSQNKASFPICWYKSSMNCINWDKEKKHIKKNELEELRNLEVQKTVQLYIKDANEWPVFGEPIIKKPDHSFSVYIQQVCTEKQIVTNCGARYKRFHVADRQYPANAEVDKFVNLIKNASNSAWFHFHCRAGKGRTTTFLALYDMMHNAPNVSADGIIKRQSIIADYQLAGTHSDPLINQLKQKRLKFLHTFYEYAREQAPHFTITFSEWCTKS